MADQRRLSRQAAERAGHRAEWLAALWLMLKGYKILARRYRCPRGEVDLVARRGQTLCFVEVKARPSHAEGLAAISRTNERRVAAAAMVWVAQNPRYAKLGRRFDAVTVADHRPQHTPNAFRLDDNQPIVNPEDFF